MVLNSCELYFMLNSGKNGVTLKELIYFLFENTEVNSSVLKKKCDFALKIKFTSVSF